MDFIKKVKAYIDEYALIPSGAAVLVACSGGPDSVALLRCLQQLGYRLAVAHVNYGLRGDDADGDEQFVKTLANKLGLAYFTHNADPATIKASSNSLQADARAIRYDFFAEILSNTDFQYCATGHSADDQVETSILSLMRGAGPALMHGIPSKRDAFVRPLRASNRAEIIEYLSSIAQDFRTDASNTGDAYLRNRIRHEVLPALNRIHPNAAERLYLQQGWYSQENHFIHSILQPFIQEAHNKSLNWKAFIEQYGQEHLPVLVAYTLASWGITGPGNRAGITLIDNQSGTGITVPAGRLERTRSGLVLKTTANTSRLQARNIPSISDDMLIDMGARKVKISLHKEGNPDFTQKDLHIINLDELVFPIQCRAWQQGDRMQPLGMQGEKLLSDIFIDEKFSTEQKERAVVVEDQVGIICLSEFRIADRTKFHQGVRRFASLKFL